MRPDLWRRVVPASFTSAALALAIGAGAWPEVRVAAQATSAPSKCTAVGGTVMTNFIRADTTLGSATGDLAGAVSATLLSVGPGTGGLTAFTVEHHWVTEAGDTIISAEAVAEGTEVKPGQFAVVKYPLEIVDGTGRFAGAKGHLDSVGTVDVGTGRTVFRYAGHVCFRPPAK